MTDLARLRQLAEAAWPGRWIAEQSSFGEPFVAWVHNDSGSVIADVHTFEDAAYIAAFNPTTAAALLDEIESLRTALGEVMAVNHSPFLGGDGARPCVCVVHENARRLLEGSHR